MPDLLIPDLDERVIARLKAAAEERKLDLASLLAEMLDFRFGSTDAGLLEEVASMRASQPKQEGDAALDVRRLRDGGDGSQDETRAA